MRQLKKNSHQFPRFIVAADWSLRWKSCGFKEEQNGAPLTLVVKPLLEIYGLLKYGVILN